MPEDLLRPELLTRVSVRFARALLGANVSAKLVLVRIPRVHPGILIEAGAEVVQGCVVHSPGSRHRR